MTGKKGQKQPKGHTWRFSHFAYEAQVAFTVKVKVERCVTPRHKHANRKTVVRKWKK